MPSPASRSVLRRPLTLLGVVLTVWFVLPVGVKSLVETTFYEFQAPSWTALSYIEDLQDYWTQRNRPRVELIQAGRDLARLNAAYRVRNQQVEGLAEEVRRLESLLDLPSAPAHKYVPARVMKRDVGLWWQQLVIRKGAADGIPEGAAVVSARGVVGRIHKVRAYTSVVELVSSRTFRMAAQVEGDARPVIYQGGINQPFAAPAGVVRSVQADVVAEDGLRLVSTRLGGIFPDGLTIGTITNLRLDEDGLFQTGVVELPNELLTLREVAVLVPFGPGS